MGRKALFACLFAGIWLTAGCEATEAGSMELVFSWPDGAPDFARETYYLRGELQVWPDGVDDDDNPITITQRFTGYSGQTADQAWVKLGDTDSLTFDGLSYDVTLGVVIQVYGPNTEGGPDPPGDLLYYGRSRPFVLRAGEHTVVEVDLAIEAAPGVVVDPPDDPGEPQNPDDPTNDQGFIRLCHVSEAAGDPDPCNDLIVPISTVALYFQAPNSAVALLANDAAFSLGYHEITLGDPVAGDLHRYPGLWDLNEGFAASPDDDVPDGPRTVFVKLRNALGLESQAFTHTVTVDTTAPTLQATLIPEKAVYGPEDTLTIQLNAPEPLDGLPTVSLGEAALTPIAISSLAWELSVALSDHVDAEDTTLTLHGEATDGVGNSQGTLELATLRVDTTKPAVVGQPILVTPGPVGDPHGIGIDWADRVAATTGDLVTVRIPLQAGDHTLDGGADALPFDACPARRP